MLDKLERTLDLIAAMKAAVPFEVELTFSSACRECSSDIAFHQLMRDILYAGDPADF